MNKSISIVPLPLITNFLPLLSGSGESENVRIPLAECGSEQPEIVARNMATLKFVPHKNRTTPPLAVKVLKVLRGLLLKKSPKQGSGQSPEVLGLGTESQGLPTSPCGKHTKKGRTDCI